MGLCLVKEANTTEHLIKKCIKLLDEKEQTIEQVRKEFPWLF